MSDLDVDPRVLRTREVVVEATAQLLTERGFTGITIEAIAERCGVARSTIYRNWPDRGRLFVEGFEQLCALPIQPASGTLEFDLRQLGHEFAAGLSNADWGRCLPSLVGAVEYDPELAEAQADFSRRRHAVIASVFSEAMQRGEIDEDLDPDSLAELWAAPFFLRRLMSHRPLDDVFIEHQIALVLRTVRR